MKRFLDKHYRLLRRFRFLYGWIKDPLTRLRSRRRGNAWRNNGLRGAKLDICGGRNPFRPGEYLNVDIAPLPQVDLVFDIRKPFPVDDGVISEIISLATLEHLRKPHVHHVLREFYRILQPGGFVRIAVPDIEAIARAVLDGADPDVWNRHLFGKFKSEDTEDLDVHRWMYTAPQMTEALRSAGFAGVERLPMDIGFHEPAFTYLLRATKPVS